MRGQKDQYRPQFALQFIGPKRWRRFSLDLDVQSLLRASNPQFAIMPILCVIGRVHQRIFHSNLRPWNRKSSKNSDPGSTLVMSKWSLARV